MRALAVVVVAVRALAAATTRGIALAAGRELAERVAEAAGGGGGTPRTEGDRPRAAVRFVSASLVAEASEFKDRVRGSGNRPVGAWSMCHEVFFIR